MWICFGGSASFFIHFNYVLGIEYNKIIMWYDMIILTNKKRYTSIVMYDVVWILWLR